MVFNLLLNVKLDLTYDRRLLTKRCLECSNELVGL